MNITRYRPLALAAFLLTAPVLAADGEKDTWTALERGVLASLQLARLPAAPADPSNAVERLPAAAALGKRLFFDVRLSKNQQVSCASCHLPEKQFQDGIALAQGVGKGIRRTMPIAAAGRQAWFFWDGRKDSLWSQALGPLEDQAEHGGNRLAYARLIERHYKPEYEAIFNTMPSLAGLPEHAAPDGSNAERAAWSAIPPARQHEVSRVFANMGKVIAAYEARLHYSPSRLDRYIDATLNDAPAAARMLTASEKRGLRLFAGQAQCITCHGGPLLTDQSFHNTGVAPHDRQQPETGRAAAIARLLRDPFNCLGLYSDANPGQCRELQFISSGDPTMNGAFKTPSLRNVAERAPYMHSGQIGSLTDVVRHYAAAPPAATGKNERRPMALSEQDITDLAGFLATLSGDIKEAAP
jgi:cytochrome c peroxidase